MLFTIYGFTIYGFTIYGFTIYGFTIYGFTIYGFVTFFDVLTQKTGVILFGLQFFATFARGKINFLYFMT